MELLYALTLGLLTELRCVSFCCGRVPSPSLVGLTLLSYACESFPVLPCRSTPACGSDRSPLRAR